MPYTVIGWIVTAADSDGWGFVVGGEPGLALSLFFGDQFGSSATFLDDPVAAVLLAGLFAARHHQRPVGLGPSTVWATANSPVDGLSAANSIPPRGSVV